MVLSSPKSGYGRLIDLDVDTTRRLVEHGDRQCLAASRLGLVNPERFVFLNPDFAPVRPDYLSERFLLISSHLGLPRIRFHDLRHTHATIALATGVPINVVSERLGHTNTSVTLNVYSHVMPGMGASAAQDIANYVTGTEQTTEATEAAAKLTRDSRHGPWHRQLEHSTGQPQKTSRFEGPQPTGREAAPIWAADESSTATRSHVPIALGLDRWQTV